MYLIPESYTSVWDIYIYLTVDIADPRTNDWFLVRHPVVVLVVLIYIHLVSSVGPKFMKNREPFELKGCLITYNFLHVLISIYLFKEGFHYGWFNGYSFKCEPVDFSNNPKALRAACACYWYYLSKISELMDTIFFVLRKKQRQVTLLHLYHHSVMPLISWGVTKYYPGGHCTFIGFINCFTHIVMYSYYMLAAMGPKFQKYLWWKKYITTLQLIQFLLAFLHSTQLLFYDCGFPRWTTIFTMPNAILFYYLFSNFYKKSYKPTELDMNNNDVNFNKRIQKNGNTTNGYSNIHAATYENNSEDLSKNNGYEKNKTD